MKKNIEKENNTMIQSDLMSDPYFDSLKKQLDESLDLENIMVSEDLIQSTLRAIEIKKETAFHEDDSVTTKEKATLPSEEKEIISIEKQREGKREGKREAKKEVKRENQSKNKRKIIKYIGTWGSVVAASILIFYLGGQGLLSQLMEGKSISMEDTNLGSSESSSEVRLGSLDKEGSNTSFDTVTPIERDVTTGNEEQELQIELKKNYELDSNDKGLEDEKVSVTSQDSLSDKTDTTMEPQANGYNLNPDGGSRKAFNYAMEDINLLNDVNTVKVNLDSSDEEKIKDIMLLMPSKHLHLTTEDPAQKIKYIISIPLTEEDEIVYFINDTEVLIKTYGNEGIVTSTSYEVDQDYDLIQDIENILQ